MKIGIFGNDCKSDKLPVIKRLFDKLRTLNIEVGVRNSYYECLDRKFDFRPEGVSVIDSPDFDLDMAVSVGGDGTFLRTAMQIGRRNIPILGINTGHLGFLADVACNQIDETLDEIVRGDYRIEERTMLQLHNKERDFGGCRYALNEVAVLKRDTSSMITINTYLDDNFFTSYQADGLVIATPTGSTAYSMSVNGPILLPQNRNFVLSPVAPHSLTVRPIVIPDNVKISLNVESRTNSFLVSLDGRSEDYPLGIYLKISKADFTTRVVKRFNQTFYQTLREKLMWGADRRS